MAEFVQQNIEETIPELEQLERVGLFSKEEIKAIVKQRTHHEYRVVRRQHDKEDFLKYIQYEVNILHLIKKRRDRMNYFFKKEEIEMTIINRILRFFRRSCTKYPEDLDLWFSYIGFAKKWNMMTELGRIYARILKVHSQNPAIWIMAAKFQMEDNNSSQNARGLMLRALRHHPTSHKLWTEYFRLELMNADKQRKRFELLKLSQMAIDENDEDMNDAVMQGEVGRMVYKQAIQQITDDLEFHLSFIPVCQQFDFTQKILDGIYTDLQDNYADNELAWDAISRRHLTNHDSEESDNAFEYLEEVKCHEEFDTAVKSLPTVKMWTLYVNFCVERLELGGNTNISNKRAKKTLLIFDHAHKACDVLPADTFLQWMTVLPMLGLIEKALQVAREAVDVHPMSVALWGRYLQLVITGSDPDNEDSKTKVKSLFDEAINKCKSKKSLPLWNIGLDWCSANDPERVETILQAGVREHKNVALALKERYLIWASLKGGIKDVRKVYAALSKEAPLSVEFFQKYISIENSQAEPKIKAIRNCYEDALREFGSSRSDLWLDYIKLELTHPKGNPSEGPSIHWRAMQTLQGEHVQTFTIKYTLMQTGH